MNLQQIFINALALFLGLSASFLMLYYFVKNDVYRFFSLKNAELNKENRAQLLPLRLQAHERLIIFIDRINPSNLLVRLHQKGIDAVALQAIILSEVNTEYQHNIAQQLYVDSNIWTVVKKLKLDTIAMINSAVQSLPAESSGLDLSKAILQHMASIEQNPYELTVELIKKDIHKLF